MLFLKEQLRCIKCKTTMFVTEIATCINSTNPVLFNSGYVKCKCIIRDTDTKEEEILNIKFKLSEISIVIDKEILRSTMNISEFRSFTNLRNIVFSAKLTYSNNGETEATDITFFDSIEK